MFKQNISAAVGAAANRLTGAGHERVAPDDDKDESNTSVEDARPEAPAKGGGSGSQSESRLPGSVGSPDTNKQKEGWATRLSDMAPSAASGAAVAAMQVAGKAGGIAAPVAVEAAAMTAAGVIVAGATAVHGVSAAAGLAKDSAEAAREWAEEKLKDFRKMMEIWVKQKIHYVASRAIDKVPPAVKAALEDDEMPRCVARCQDRMIDATWPHVREEVMWELAVYLDGASDEAEVEHPEGKVNCCTAFFRYHLYPFDRGFWRQLRDPIWWLFALVAMVPVHGISPAVFVIRFFIIDRSDEFQLIQYILEFKGMQFITQGVIRSIAGYFAFVACVTVPAQEANHRCDKSGPGVYGPASVLGVIGYIVTHIVVWISFCLLRCSVERGRSTLKGNLNVDPESSRVIRSKRGGFLKYFVFWDVAVFIIFVGVCIYVATTRPALEVGDWALDQTIYAGQIAHGLLSAPFFFFTLPGLSRVLTHSLPTGYDKNGRCRPLRTPPAVAQERKDKADQPQQIVVSESEAADLWSRLRLKAGMPKIPGFAD
mmetsp:Transcript_124211/g.247482  ORF Transcript_124211/g.247482 Transcript_124211/m.247482 type:complete len:540 (-) Transcript_124211:72-1691(-)